MKNFGGHCYGGVDGFFTLLLADRLLTVMPCVLKDLVSLDIGSPETEIKGSIVNFL